MARTYYFSVIFLFLLVFTVFFPFFPLSAAPAKKCTGCARRIRGTYFTMKGKTYCSKSCLENALPKCSVCRKTLERYMQSPVTGMKYCENCAAKPKCFFCGDVAGNGAGYRITEQMLLCRSCRNTSVSNTGKAYSLFTLIRNQLKQRLGTGTDHIISFHLTTYPVLQRKLSGSSHVPRTGQTGLYECQTLTRTEKKVDVRTGKTVASRVSSVRKKHFIYILSSLPDAEYRHAVVHELTHDWLGEYYPRLNDPKIQEGVCEYMAYLFLEEERKKDTGVRLALARMENNPDPVYGEGFRFICKIAGQGDRKTRLERVKNFLAKR